MTGEDLRREMAKHPQAKNWEEWSHGEQPGKEPDQEPVQLAPLPAYEYPTTTKGPKRSKVPGNAPPPVQLVRDPERVIVPEVPQTFAQPLERPRENAPVSTSPTSPHSPTPARTRPFMPSSREPGKMHLCQLYMMCRLLNHLPTRQDLHQKHKNRHKNHLHMCRNLSRTCCRQIVCQIYQIVLNPTIWQAIWQTIWRSLKRHKNHAHRSPRLSLKGSNLLGGEWEESAHFLK